jgi:hypothetical protein
MTSSTIFPFHFFSSGKTSYLLFQKGSKERRRNFSLPFSHNSERKKPRVSKFIKPMA